MRVARKDKRKKRPVVVSGSGRFPFQTGMVTASLLQRGLSMPDALEIARSVRDAVAKHEEIESADLKERINEHIEERLGPELASRSRVDESLDDRVPLIETAHGCFPFSRGVIVRHLDTSGLKLDQAVALVTDVERWVRAQKKTLLSERQLHAAVAQLVAERHGESAARRYRLTDWVHRTEKPMTILIGGATGTGKSTLAMELAYRLGFVWVTSTDLIRETMRTVLSPDLVPGLHDHSFRGMVEGGQVLSDPRERVLAGFRQQAAQVAVGIRAVIARALRENVHVLIEGTHIAPPFYQYLPPGVDVSVAGFILAVPDEKEHRARFPERSRHQPQRAADTYLEAFQSVRWIHDDLLAMAEDNETLVLPSTSKTKTLIGAVDFLSQELPVNDKSPGSIRPQPAFYPRRSGIPTLFLILDGLADEANPALGNKTPLAAARIPTLRRLAAQGGQGQVLTARSAQEVPATDNGLLALLSGRREPRLGRGLFEALGRGIPLPPGAIVFRGNLATVDDDDAVLDRRAGRIRLGVEDLLSDLSHVNLAGGISGRVFPGHEHRVLVVLNGVGLSANVSDTDPGGHGQAQRLMAARAMDLSPEAARTATALRDLLSIARRRLSVHPLNAQRLQQGLPLANAIITRGAAMAPPRPTHREPVGAIITGCNTALGVGRYVGLHAVTDRSMTGNLDTDLDAKFGAAAEMLEEYELVVVHIKGTDIAAHDRKPLIKRDFIEKIDAALARFLSAHPALSGSLRVVVSADHVTSSISGNHLAGAVPLLLATWHADHDEEAEFDEESCARGALGVLQSGELGELLGSS